MAKPNRKPKPAAGQLPPRGRMASGIEIAHVDVPDPYAIREDGRLPRPIKAAVNIRSTVLEWERNRGLIDDDQYRAGRRVEDIFEHDPGAGDNAGIRLALADRVELAIAASLDRAADRVNAISGMVRVLGEVDARVVQRVIRDRWTYDAVAQELGVYTSRGSWYAAQRFRGALALLAERGWG